MIRAVLDTNVIVSSLLSPAGVPDRIVRAWKAGLFEICSSQPLLDELARVLRRPAITKAARVLPDEIDEFLDLIAKTAVFALEPLAVLSVIVEDPADDAVLATALAVEADAIVSGDNHLLALGEYEGIPIVTPRRFLELLSLQE